METSSLRKRGKPSHSFGPVNLLRLLGATQFSIAATVLVHLPRGCLATALLLDMVLEKLVKSNFAFEYGLEFGHLCFYCGECGFYAMPELFKS